MRIELDIERLVLHGISLTPAERTALGQSLTVELSRLLAAGGSALSGGAVPMARGADIVLGTPFDPVATGASIARAAYGGISGGIGLGGANGAPRTDGK